MSFVLGLSMTSAGARAVLVEGAAGDGATIHTFAAVTADGLVTALSEDPVIGPVLADHTSAIGVTWSPGQADTGAAVIADLAAAGRADVTTVAELDAAETLAIGIADLAGYDDVAVCILEPDATLVALVGRDRVTIEGVDRYPTNSVDDIAAGIAGQVGAAGTALQTVFVVGSADDVDAVVSALPAYTDLPVLSAQAGDLALARGAALVSARAAVSTPSGPNVRALLSNVGALSSVLVAASVTFVVSLSVAVGLQLTPEATPEQRPTARVADERPAVSPPSVARAAPAPPPEALPPAPPPEAVEVPPLEAVPEAPPVREVAAAHPPPAAPPPVVEAPPPPPAAPPPPPPAHVPPEPAYVPPPEPAYVPPPPPPAYVAPPPPANPAPQPRIRDRIIERIPIINRFHEPQLQYPR